MFEAGAEAKLCIAKGTELPVAGLGLGLRNLGLLCIDVECLLPEDKDDGDDVTEDGPDGEVDEW